jgi:hypothetical protein
MPTNIVLTNQISEAVFICIAISLTCQAGALRLAEFTITMRFSGTTTTLARAGAAIRRTGRAILEKFADAINSIEVEFGFTITAAPVIVTSQLSRRIFVPIHQYGVRTLAS